jgi:HD-GYP domain-containing protein (c-di-GMP phosphodiesterase class II)
VTDKHDEHRTRLTEYPVTIDQLQPGVFIRITGLSWRHHPFLMNSFKISRKEQIEVLRRLKINTVLFIPSKSDVFPLSEQNTPTPAPEVASVPTEDVEMERLWQEKRERIDRQKSLRKKIKACQKQFSVNIETVRTVMRNIESGWLESAKDADDLLKSIINDLVIEKDTAVQLMNTAPGSECVFYHSLNVSVLSMMLGREHGLGPEELRIIGLGALFHDVGKHRVPKNVLYKTTFLTKFERDILRLHPRYGAETMEPLTSMGTFPAEALAIIKDHHERIDGSGYPAGLKGQQLSDLTKIVSIVNRYDNLCNNRNSEKSVTPHEALAHMFKSEKEQFDNWLLQRFISYMGVYPPGTIIRLSNEVIGMVISVNPINSLKPTLLIYDPDIPKNEALIFDLSDDLSLSIAESVRPQELPNAIYDYLNPRVRVSYYLATEDRQKAGKPVDGQTRKQ